MTMPVPHTQAQGRPASKVVTYTCTDCGTQTDSTKPMIGWAFGSTGQRWCPPCDAARMRAKRGGAA